MGESWIRGHVDSSDGFPRIDWNAVAPKIMESRPEAQWTHEFTAAAREWLAEAGPAVGIGHRVNESTNFLMLGPWPADEASSVLRFLEKARARILSELLAGIAASDWHGKQVVIVFDSRSRYTSYIAYFYPREGEFAAGGGLFVQAPPSPTAVWGYGHIVVPGKERGEVERVVSHELTHNHLRHLPLPSWLNEGIASTVESVLMARPSLVVRPEDLEDHRSHWCGGRIQEFWGGRAVHLPNEGARLSYHLACMAVKALAHDRESFRGFVLHANHGDGGDAAFRRVYGKGLGSLVEQLLGPGDWGPRPDTWPGSKPGCLPSHPSLRIR